MKKRSSTNPSKAGPPSSAPKTSSRDLQELLDAISSGAIADVDELEEHEFDLLRAYANGDESVQALLDRLRAADPGEA